MDSQNIYDQVHTHYSAVSHGTSAKYSEAIAKSFGYSEEELAGIPEGSNLGLSCGNPLAITSIRKGETVIDLGSGAGFDVFLAASRVGSSGKAIGVDMNKDMLARANKIKSEQKKANVEFVESRITDISVLDSDIADCVISNCVVNLVPEPEKQLVFNEIHRLLKPGGRVALSDVLAKKPLPDDLRSDVAMYVGCIAGASLVSGYESYLKQAGFKEILISDTHSDLNVYFETGEDGSKKTNGCAPAQGSDDKNKSCTPAKASFCGLNSSCCSADGRSPVNDGVDLSGINLNDWVGSFKIYAVKG